MTELATLAGGCFWCLEAAFEQLKGVTGVTSGYAGGAMAEPTYEAVCSGATGHAEVVQVQFDPAVIGYRDLLDVFFTIHDPTTPNRQGNDVGTQYRSAIFIHSDDQRRIANEVIAELQPQVAAKVVTEVKPAPDYYRAENHHQEYFRHNAGQGYCMFVVAPKVAKFRKTFAAKRKKSAGD